MNNAIILLAAAAFMAAAAAVQYKNLRMRREIARYDADIARTKARTEKLRIQVETAKNEGKRIDEAKILAEKELASLKTMIYECNMAIVDQIGPLDFEEFTTRLLNQSGYTQVDTTPASGDKGADIIAIAPDGRRTCFQCKHYKNSVGTAAVQEVIAAAQYYGCAQAAVITTSAFTRQAKELAVQAGVYLMDRGYISALMENCISECASAVKDKKAYISRIAQARMNAQQQYYDSL